MKIIVASKNIVKIESVRLGFERMFPGESFEIEGISVPSGVSDQPMGDTETRTGARNRLEAARREKPNADLWVAIEGGCTDTPDGLEAFAWVAAQGVSGTLCESKTGTFFLPPAVADLVRSGVELGHADDQVFGRQNSKEQNGAVGILTANAIDRTEYYAHAVVLALIPMKNQELFQKS